MMNDAGRKTRVWRFMESVMMLFGVFLLLVSCGGDSGSSPSPATFVSLKINTDQTTRDVDVNPAQDVVVKDIVLQGLASVQEYRVSYVREDGHAKVPDSFRVAIDPSSVTSGDGLKIKELILLKKDALQRSPFVPYSGPVNVQAQLTFWGEDRAGKSTSGKIVFSLVCADF